MSAKVILRSKIEDKSAIIGVIGLGYVGLPLIVEFCLRGFKGIGFEVDKRKVDLINSGKSYVVDVPNERVEKCVAEGKLVATLDFPKLSDCDVIIICVPTPLRKTKDPDMSYILAAGEEVKNYARSGQLVILESTTYPGTTDEVLLPMIEETGLKLDQDFLLAFSPERVDPGNPHFQTHNIPKVVGGVSKDSTEIASLLYSQIVEQVHPVSSSRVAEAAKLWENTFRAINIGMANEMAKLCRALGIDTWEVVKAAATKPFGFMPFYPGPGIGGHCLVGKETVMVRYADGIKIKNIAELFAEQSSDFSVRTFRFSDGTEIAYNPNFEVFSIDMTSGKPAWKPVKFLFKRLTKGQIYKIFINDKSYLAVTDLHPMIVSDKKGSLRQVYAKDLQVGDRLPAYYPITEDINEEIQIPSHKVEKGWTIAPANPEIDLISTLPSEMREKVRVQLLAGSWQRYARKKRAKEKIYRGPIPLKDYLTLRERGEIHLPNEAVLLCIGRGSSFASFPAIFFITPDIARLIGYYLAKGSATKKEESWQVLFSFNHDEKEAAEDLISILKDNLKIKFQKSSSESGIQVHIRFSLFGWILCELLKCGKHSTEMRIPEILLSASPIHQRELLKGLLRGNCEICFDSEKPSEHPSSDITGEESCTSAFNVSLRIEFLAKNELLLKQVADLLRSLGFTQVCNSRSLRIVFNEYEQMLRLSEWLGEKGQAVRKALRIKNTSENTKELITIPVKSIEIEELKTSREVYSMEVLDTNTFATSHGIFVHNCIPLDPHYLSWKARQHGFDSKFISLAEEINSSMPKFVVELVRDALNEERKSLNGSRILILGVAYKRDIDDVRESPALSIIDLLRSQGAQVLYHDPFVSELTFDHSYTIGSGEPLYNQELTDELVRSADCIVICTDHSCIDYKHICELATLIVDTRNALSEEVRNGSKAKIVRL